MRERVFDCLSNLKGRTEQCTKTVHDRLLDSFNVSRICNSIIEIQTEIEEIEREYDQITSQIGINAMSNSQDTASQASGNNWINQSSKLIAKLEKRRKDAEDSISSLKKSLPAICYVAHFPKGRRVNSDAQESGLGFFDMDDLDDPMAVWRSVSEKAIACGTVKAEISASNHGLHFIFKRPKGMTTQQSMVWFAQSIGITEYDASVKDLARACFVVPRRNVLFLDEKGLFYHSDDEVATSAEARPATAPASVPVVASVPAAEPLPAPAAEIPADAALSEPAFHDVPYALIVRRLLNFMGILGDPQEGERNVTLFALARNMRYICDFDINRMKQVIPSWGLPESEVNTTLQSAISCMRSAQMPRELQHALKMLESELKSLNEPEDDESECIIPELPRLLQLLVKPFPASHHAAVILSALPILGTLATGVRIRYMDNTVHSLSFITCIVAHQAGGKSFVRWLTDMLMADIQRADEVNRQIEREFIEKRKMLKNSRKQPEEPNVCIRMLPPSVSNAMLFKRLTKAKAKHLFTVAEEIDSLTKAQKSGSWSQKDDLLRQAFDNSLGGQDYMSENSWSAMVRIYYNLLFCGTHNAVYRFFNDVENGLVSRVCFSQLPDTLGAPIPVFNELSEGEIEEVKNSVKMLMNEGLNNAEDDPDRLTETIEYDTPRLRHVINEWMNQKRMEYLENQDNAALDIFRRRAGVIGFRAGALAFVLNDHTEDVRCCNFATWIAQYVLDQQLSLFGSRLNKAMQTDITVEKTYPVQSLLKKMPEIFDKEKLIEMRQMNGQSTNVKMIICRWVKNGLVEKIGPNKWRKKSNTTPKSPATDQNATDNNGLSAA